MFCTFAESFSGMDTNEKLDFRSHKLGSHL